MSLRELQQVLKSGSLPSLILLYGEETYFIDQGVTLILDTVVPLEARDFNLTQYHGRDIKAPDVIDQARTFPVFAPQRLILIKHLDEAPADQLESLIDYLEDPVPETVLMMTAEKIDARRKFFQKLRKTGRVFEFKKVYENQLPAHVREMAKGLGVTFTADGLKLFCKRVGASLVEVRGELDKLVNYLGEKDLAEESDVAAVVSDTRTESIFQLMDALGQGRRDLALCLLHRLLAEGQAPLMILAMIVRHFRQMWKAHHLVNQGVPQKEMPRQIGISPYFLQGLIDQASCYDDARFKEAFDAFLQTDLALKSSGGEPQAHLEELILKIGLLRQN